MSYDILTVVRKDNSKCSICKQDLVQPGRLSPVAAVLFTSAFVVKAENAAYMTDHLGEQDDPIQEGDVGIDMNYHDDAYYHAHCLRNLLTGNI